MGTRSRASRRVPTNGEPRGEQAPGSTRDAAPAVNVALVVGECSAPPEVRVLESGSRVAALAVRCPAPDGRLTSVPVTVWDPAPWLEGLGAGDRVVVAGAG